MMVATYKCGCPPTEKKPSCSPCCKSSASSGGDTVKPASSAKDCPKGACCNKRAQKPTVSRPKFEEQAPPCCPTIDAIDTNDFERPRKLRSEIAEKGLPYNEMEVTINNNRLVIRSQKEEAAPKYEPPCDCVDDAQPVSRLDDEIGQLPAPGTRTVTLYPQTWTEKVDERDDVDAEFCPREEERTIERTAERTTDKPENPNIFVLRVKRKSNNGDMRFDIDLEFKTPRPWSIRKRTEYETQWRKLEATVKKKPSTIVRDEAKVEEEEEEDDRPRKKRKRKK